MANSLCGGICSYCPHGLAFSMLCKEKREVVGEPLPSESMQDIKPIEKTMGIGAVTS